MKINADQTVGYILDDEGPEFNRGGSEPGGGSKYGISLTVLQEVRPGATLDQLSVLQRDAAASIYHDHILPTIQFDELPGGVDYRLADIRTNLGAVGSISLVELIMGIWPVMGRLDANLMHKVTTTRPELLVFALSAAWITKKHQSPNWYPSPITKTGYGHGWSNRNNRAMKRALTMLGQT